MFLKKDSEVGETMKKMIFIIGLISGGWVEPVFGYIDPGTGMAVATGIGGLIVGFFALVFGAIVLTFKKWINFFKKIFRRIKNKITGRASASDATLKQPNSKD